MLTAKKPGAAGGAAGAGAIKAGGCFKCGGKDHWSRDCGVPQDQWIKKGAAVPDGQVGLSAENDPAK